MAEVLAEHGDFDFDPDTYPGMVCECGTKFPWLDGANDGLPAFAAHQAEVLAANGYGKLEDAFEQGRKSGMRHADRVTAALKIGRPELAGSPSPNPYQTKEN